MFQLSPPIEGQNLICIKPLSGEEHILEVMQILKGDSDITLYRFRSRMTEQGSLTNTNHTQTAQSAPQWLVGILKEAMAVPHIKGIHDIPGNISNRGSKEFPQKIITLWQSVVKTSTRYFEV